MKTLFFILLLIVPNFIFSQQVADTNYNPKILKPQYKTGKGSVVFIDEAHHNFHTKNGRFKAFSNLLERDGYVVKDYTNLFDQQALSKGRILVISNALNEINVENWYLPTPSAFSKTEIEEVKKWVKVGGSLFLIADHMPFAGAAKDLAATFEFEFTNGFAFDTLSQGPAIFSLENGSLIESEITKGRDTAESVQKIATFTGQGFNIPDEATPIILFNGNYMNLMPDTAWVFDAKTVKFNLKGWSQGAFRKYGKGKVVVFGEAAMFTAQLAGPQQVKMGMNNAVAPENYQLLLNIIHWLDGKLD